MKQKLQFKHGWNPDLPDHRDCMYQESHHFFRESAAEVPMTADLRKAPATPAIEDQGQLGSCTAFGTLAAARFVRKMQGASGAPLSHLYQYYNTRSLEGTVGSDSGGTIRDAFKALAKFGAIPEKDFKYDIREALRKPTPKMYELGAKDQALQYLRVENDMHRDGVKKIMTCVAAGYPVVFGASLYESFENPGPDKNGLITVPSKKEQQLGGHCMAIWGYDAQERHAFLVRNSWGSGFGIGGYIWIPFTYLCNRDLADDFWTLRKMES
jgi:C1A family cysteine protease